MFDMAKMFFTVGCLLFLVTQSVHGYSPPSYADCNSECQLPSDCTEIFQSGLTVSGVYQIQPVAHSESFYVYCDMDTDGGGWTTFQRREDGSVGFYRDWADYKAGFGNPNSEYWLGNDNLFHLTAQGSYELRVDLEDFEGETRYASYDNFRIGDELTFYKLFLGAYTGNAGDSLSRHAANPFSTYDADHDDSGTINCASTYKGAWWYDACQSSNLNGAYLGGRGDNESYADGIEWADWRGHYYSLKVAEMKMRRL